MDARASLARQMVDRLRSGRKEFSAQFNAPAGTTTRHFFCDGLLPADTTLAVHAAFKSEAGKFIRRETIRERKGTSAALDSHARILADVTFAMQSREAVAEISAVTGMELLEPDPSLYGSGLSIMARGDYLHPHIDNSHDSARSRYRRLNLLYYVSEGWTLDDGGNFEMWDAAVRKPVRLVSAFNRLVVMETTRTSYHSVDEVKADAMRCCVSSYYFSRRSPDGTDYFHVTAFKGRPERPWARTVLAADTTLRNMAARSLGLGRGKNLVYTPARGETE